MFSIILLIFYYTFHTVIFHPRVVLRMNENNTTANQPVVEGE